MLDRYKTILKEAEAEITEKKSRFIAYVRPVKNEEEARSFVEEIKKKNWNATHNVFAYQIGENNEIQRFSDDGEPQGTAGLPVLDVLRGPDIKNTAIVVTRYFGGTLLGTGGLVRAYGKAAKAGIDSSGIVEMILYNEFSVKTSYSLSGKIQYAVLKAGHTMRNTIYEENVKFTVLVEKEKGSSFIDNIIEISNGQSETLCQRQVYGAWINGELAICD